MSTLRLSFGGIVIRVELSEKQIENQALGWLKSKMIFAFKVKSMGTFDPVTKRFRAPSPWYKKGCPDILCCYRGKFVGLEIKTKKGRLSEYQKAFHMELVESGGYAFVVRDIDELPAIFTYLDHLNELPTL